MMDPIVRGEVITLLQRREGLSEAELARRAYPERSPGSARQRLRSLKAAPVTVLRGRKIDGQQEARQLAKVLGISTHMLGQRVYYVLARVEENIHGQPIPGRFLAPAGGIIAWHSEDEAREAVGVVKRSGLYDSIGVVGLVEGELLDRSLTRHEEEPWRWYNENWAIGASFDDLETLLIVERYARGEEQLLDYIAWHFAHTVLTHVARVFQASTRSERKARLGRLISRVVEIDVDEAAWDAVKAAVGNAPPPPPRGDDHAR